MLKLVALPCALALSAAPSANNAALREWLVPRCPGLDGSRAALEDAAAGGGGGLAVRAARAYNRGQTIFAVSDAALLTAQCAYADKDMGPPLRDVARVAGPGFGVVGVAGLLAAERTRQFRARADQGLAPESAGVVVPSRWGPLCRELWRRRRATTGAAGGGADDAALRDPEIAPLVAQGVDILLPLLDVVARRAWSAPAPDPKVAFGSAEWAWKAMYDDGDARSWSRAELAALARDAFAIALDLQREPPPPAPRFDGDGAAGPPRAAPDGWTLTGATISEPGRRAEGSEVTEPLAIVPPLVALGASPSDATNAAYGSFSGRAPPAGEPTPALVCVATRDIAPGDLVVAPDPWL